MERKGFIGGSDISVVMGVNPWKTPLQLWAEKTGAVEPADLSDNEAVQMGIELEDTVARLFTKKTGMAVRRAPQNYTLPGCDWARCQVDRLVTGTDELLEVKTASAWNEKEWEGEEIPTAYILQVQWQLLITGRSVGWIAVLIGGQKFRYKKIEQNAEIQAKMLESASAFWAMVQNNTPPVVEAADNSFMVELYPTAGPEIAEASQDIVAAVDLLQQTKMQIKDLTETKDLLEAQIKDSIKGFGGIKTPKWTIKWSFVKGSTYTVTKEDGRMLRITKNKGE
jgi:putative phage-type endonuclease